MKKLIEKEIIQIVDFQKEPEDLLKSIMKPFFGVVIDWMEKDYGLILDIEVPVEFARDLENAIIMDSSSNFSIN